MAASSCKKRKLEQSDKTRLPLDKVPHNIWETVMQMLVPGENKLNALNERIDWWESMKLSFYLKDVLSLRAASKFFYKTVHACLLFVDMPLVLTEDSFSDSLKNREKRAFLKLIRTETSWKFTRVRLMPFDSDGLVANESKILSFLREHESMFNLESFCIEVPFRPCVKFEKLNEFLNSGQLFSNKTFLEIKLFVLRDISDFVSPFNFKGENRVKYCLTLPAYSGNTALYFNAALAGFKNLTSLTCLLDQPYDQPYFSLQKLSSLTFLTRLKIHNLKSFAQNMNVCFPNVKRLEINAINPFDNFAHNLDKVFPSLTFFGLQNYYKNCYVHTDDQFILPPSCQYLKAQSFLVYHFKNCSQIKYLFVEHELLVVKRRGDLLWTDLNNLPIPLVFLSAHFCDPRVKLNEYPDSESDLYENQGELTDYQKVKNWTQRRNKRIEDLLKKQPNLEILNVEVQRVKPTDGFNKIVAKENASWLKKNRRFLANHPVQMIICNGNLLYTVDKLSLAHMYKFQKIMRHFGRQIDEF